MQAAPPGRAQADVTRRRQMDHRAEHNDMSQMVRQTARPSPKGCADISHMVREAAQPIKPKEMVSHMETNEFHNPRYCCKRSTTQMAASPHVAHGNLLAKPRWRAKPPRRAQTDVTHTADKSQMVRQAAGPSPNGHSNPFNRQVTNGAPSRRTEPKRT